jgi:hypothetical protein
MGSHRSPEDMLASVEAGAVAERARALAEQMNGWLGARPNYTLLSHGNTGSGTPTDGAPSDLVEWCRSARDVLEAVARG